MDITVINEREQTYHNYEGVQEIYVDIDTCNLSFSMIDELSGNYANVEIYSNDYTSFRVNKG